MDKKTKIKKLLAVLKPDATQVDFADFDKKVKELQDRLKEKIQAQTLDDVRSQLDKFQKKIDFTPLSDSVQSIEEGINVKLEAISQAIDEELATLKGLIDSKDSEAKGGITQVNEDIKLLEAEYKGLDLKKTTDIAELKDRIRQLSSIADTATQAISGLKDVLEESRGDVNVIRDDLQAITSSNINSLEKLRQELSNRINNLRIGGGNQNRNITVEGRSILGKFTDINLYGTTTSLITSVNNNKGVVNIGIPAGGGGGTPGGSDTQIQFNDGGSFGGDSALTWDKTGNAINLTGDIYIETTGLASDRYISVNSQAVADTNAGDLNIQGGGGNGAGKGSDVVIMSGNGGTSGDGGILDIRSGSGGTTGSAGYFNLQGGDGNGAGKTGGAFYLTSGGGLNGANGGEIYFTLGQATGGGAKGSFKVNTNGSRAGALDFDSITTTDKTFTFPDQSGTLASPASVASAGLYLQTLGGGLSQWASVVAGGSGITRTSSTISVNTTGGTTANTDYVYFTNVGIRFNLPSVAGLSNNQYTVKNMANSSVLIVSSEGIDDSATALITGQYQSLTFNHNGSVYGVV